MHFSGALTLVRGGLLAVDHPRNPKLIDAHAETRRPECLLKRHRHPGFMMAPAPRLVSQLYNYLWKREHTHSCSAASFNFATSSFFICINAFMTRSDFFGSPLCRSSGRIFGTTCHDKPYLSLSQPHWTSWPPSAVSFSQK